MCCSAPAAPDYTPIAAANAASAHDAKEAADNDLAFRKQQWTAQQPILKQAMDSSKQVSDAQIKSMGEASSRATSQWNDYTQTYQPIEHKMAQEAMDYGGEADQQRLAGRAIADVNSAGSNARAQGRRALQAMGVNPNSGRFASLTGAQDTAQAANAAGAATNARTSAVDKGMALRAGAASFGRNMPNTAGQMMGTSNTAGNSATSNAIAGANAWVPGATYASGGVGNAINASSVGIQSGLGMGQLMNASYQNSGSDMSGLGALAGFAGKAALGYFTGGASLAATGLADGGVVRGPGNGVSDSVQAVTNTGDPVRLSNGEYVIPADVVRAIGKRSLDALVNKHHTPAAVQRQAMRA